MDYPWHLYLMGIMYVIAGCMHFIKPAIYLRIMPRYLPAPKLLVYLSGLAEIILGIAVCFPLTKDLALWGIMLMLALFFMVHFHMLSSEKAAAGFPKWLLIVRILMQFGLIYWAYCYLSL
ncbi:MauE/DoxX family redox-associated membrane protein [Flavimarina sp. Hel_I_48]|uniref:DoxX family protein n=1 Tax=Flavimarina sp. Hel_I_48 TaxID=1392488 RepID=UPI0004DF832B|nr:MauE/DoxX family redox-associated membrane protein [Flavimarina sp. Hel_I_48]